jgi:hypothetical protein
VPAHLFARSAIRILTGNPQRIELLPNRRQSSSGRITVHTEITLWSAALRWLRNC